MDIFIPDAKPQNLVRGFIWPTLQKHGITSGYGWRNHPIFDEKHFHTGLDIYCKYGWIRAAKFGKVTYTGWLGGYGKTIIISHPGGWKTLYGHLSRISVKTGQYVKQGQFIGKSGNTGNSTGPHLHFEIISNGEYKNPRKMIK
ncbi:MAG: M23 family metallopeptidase [Spirochaetes bacterium]|nr:M23 family metallopeptidase [Spirochaetota bacterium]